MSKIKISLFLCGVVVIVTLSLALPVGAQSPVGGALATLAAATAQADQWQSSQRAAQATRAAVSFEATQSTAATRTTFDYQVTQSAQVELDRQRAATATAESISLDATRTAYAQDQNAVATRQGIESEATRTNYYIQLAEIQRRSNFGTLLLYVAGFMALCACAYIMLTLARKVTKPVVPVITTDIVDGNFTPVLALPSPIKRMGNVRVIDDPRIIEAAIQWFDDEEGKDGNSD